MGLGGEGGWALPLAGVPVQGLSPSGYGGFWGVGSQPRASCTNKPMELLDSSYNDLFLPELSCVKLNDATGELPLLKIFSIALPQYQLFRNARMKNKVKRMRELSSVRASKLFDNLEINSSICSLSLLEELQVGLSLPQLIAENHQLQMEKHVPPTGAPTVQPSCSHSPPAMAKGDASLSLTSFSWLPSADTSSPLRYLASGAVAR